MLSTAHASVVMYYVFQGWRVGWSNAWWWKWWCRGRCRGQGLQTGMMLRTGPWRRRSIAPPGVKDSSSIRPHEFIRETKSGR